MMIFFFFLGISSGFAFSDAGLFSGAPFPAPAFSALSSFSIFVFSAADVFCTAFLSTGTSVAAAVSFAAFPGSFPPVLKCPLTRAIASSSMELCAAFTSIPFSFRYVMISLLCISNSFASSCTFIFAIYCSPSYSQTLRFLFVSLAFSSVYPSSASFLPASYLLILILQSAFGSHLRILCL